MCIRQTMERLGGGGAFGKASCNIEHVIYPSAPVSQSRSVPVVAEIRGSRPRCLCDDVPELTEERQGGHQNCPV